MRYDLWIIIIVLAFALATGTAFGYPWEASLIAALGIIAWLIYRFRVLLLWIKQPTINAIPESSGQLYLIHRELHRKARSARKRKRQLTSLFSQFRQAVSALPDAIILLDDAGHIRWANHNAELMFGVRWPGDANLRFGNLVRNPKLEELLSRKINLNPQFNPLEGVSEAPTMGGKQIGIEINSNINPDQVLNIKLIPYTDELRMIVARDVTRLINVNRMHKDFVANVSHELKTPLTVLRGYLEILSNKNDIDSALIKPIEQMKLQTERMQLLVQDLLFLSKIEDRPHADQEAIIDVEQLISNIVEMTNPKIVAKDHQLSREIDGAIRIRGKASELHSAFTNLIVNAINYTEQGGNISLQWQRHKNGVRFTVKDTGQGIPRHHIPRLTERFYRVDTDRSRDRGGTGLGLAIVKHVMQRHDGVLEIDSTEGKGSSFSCHFPLSRIVERKMENPS